ncbi:MAG: hypothetical protein GJ676_09325 [Rhodobacteraceae bacterium]|nr:hypothetical protein [Paracoccaceae bacterium]
MSIDIKVLELTHLDAAFDLATQTFAEASTLHRALKIGLNEYKEYLRDPFQLMVKEGLSIAATDNHSGHLVGCLVVTDFARQLFEETNTNTKFSPLSALTEDLCRQYQSKRDVSVGEAILVDMAAVSEEAAGKGVYQQMRAAAHDLARSQGFQLVIGELSSAATQHVVLELLGHKKMAEIAFAEFQFGEERPFQEIKEPPSIILSEGRL